jgi:Flp pilus assembly protein TadG
MATPKHSERAAQPASAAQRGAVLLEFALASTIFMALVYGAVTYGVMFWVKGTITHAAGEGARAAIGAPDAVTTAKTTAEAILDRSLPNGAAPYAKPVTPTTGPCPGNPSGSCITVTVSYPYAAHPIIPRLPFLPGLPAQIKATSIVELS